MHSRARLLLTALLASACSREPTAASKAGKTPAPAAAPRPNVILITLDTTRADHLSVYGYERPTTPCLEKFATQATKYQRAHSTAPWTLPSHASLFTGLYPFQHGAHEVRVDFSDPKVKTNVITLAERNLTLAEALKAAGYQTGAIVANHGYLATRYHVNQGFDYYDVERAKVGVIARRALKWLAKRDARPFFLFVNTMDTHRPYNTTPRPGFLGREIPENAGENLMQLYAHVLGTAGPAPQKLKTLADQYDLALANLDEGIGAFFDQLRELGLFDSSMIVVTADHGEYLGEHDLIEHSKDVYEQTMHVPLLVKLPGQQEGRVEPQNVSLVHVAGMIVHCVFGADAAGPAQPLVQSWPAPFALAECYFSRIKDLRAPWGSRFDRIRTVLYLEDFKYIRSSDGQHELYDLAADPLEQTNALETNAARRALFDKRLDDWLAQLGPAAEPGELESVDDATEERMKELGY